MRPVGAIIEIDKIIILDNIYIYMNNINSIILSAIRTPEGRPVGCRSGGRPGNFCGRRGSRTKRRWPTRGPPRNVFAAPVIYMKKKSFKIYSFYIDVRVRRLRVATKTIKNFVLFVRIDT